MLGKPGTHELVPRPLGKGQTSQLHSDIFYVTHHIAWTFSPINFPCLSLCISYQLLAILGEQFIVGNEMCGVVISIRPTEDIISLWNRTASDNSITARIRSELPLVAESVLLVTFITYSTPEPPGYSLSSDSKSLPFPTVLLHVFYSLFSVPSLRFFSFQQSFVGTWHVINCMLRGTGTRWSFLLLN
jgi:hypothetical protein